jgi:hypothetical protein
MNRASDAMTGCCAEERSTDRLAACVLGWFGMPGADGLAVQAGDFARPRRPTAHRRADAGRDQYRPVPDGPMAFASIPEVGLDEALSDPIVRSLMAADGVDPGELETELGELRKTLARQRRNDPAA